MRRSLIHHTIRTAALHTRAFSIAAGAGRRVVALWGNGDYGRLGLGTLESKWKPAFCRSFTDENDYPVAVACGGAHTLFLTEKGHVYATGLNNFGQLGVPSAGGHSLSWQWLDGRLRLLCNGDEPILEPIKVPVEVDGLKRSVVQIAAGYYHSAAVTGDDVPGVKMAKEFPGRQFVIKDLDTLRRRRAFHVGKNSNGQLGLGRKSASVIFNPAKVDSLVGLHVKKVALGSEHSLAVTVEGDVLSWGEGSGGRLGHGQQSGIFGLTRYSSEYVPRLIKTFEDVLVKKIAAGFLHSACIDEKGSVYLFGERLADKFDFDKRKDASIPHVIEDLSSSEEVACGGYHTCAISSDGTLYAWGSNENGCLGLGCSDLVRSPAKVESSLFKFPISEVSCGWKHTLVISGGNVFAWGWGGANGTFFQEDHSSGGQLGLGNDMDCNIPLLVDFGMDCKALHVSCGFNHTAAIIECT